MGQPRYMPGFGSSLGTVVDGFAIRVSDYSDQ